MSARREGEIKLVLFSGIFHDVKIYISDVWRVGTWLATKSDSHWQRLHLHLPRLEHRGDSEFSRQPSISWLQPQLYPLYPWSQTQAPHFRFPRPEHKEEFVLNVYGNKDKELINDVDQRFDLELKVSITIIGHHIQWNNSTGWPQKTEHELLQCWWKREVR